MKKIEIDDFFFKLALLLFVIIAIIQISASMFGWYYIFPQLDVPMHVMGGMLVASVVLAVLPESMSVLKKLLWVFIVVTVVGVGVELIEWLVDTVVRPISYQSLQQGSLDTYDDLLNNSLGGILTFCFAYFSKRI
jgi:hypothetical protein